MKFTTKATITGIKGSKGTLENGTSYDSTKVYVVTELDDSKGMGKGTATAEYTYGSSDKYHELKGAAFPLDAEVDLEVVTNGVKQKTLITAIRLVQPLKKAA